MTNFNVLTTNDAAQWQRTLENCAPHDFYHLPQYHALAEASGEGIAKLFVYTEGAYTIALPLLLRDLDADLQAPGWKDATSVYGYAGPVCSASEIPESVVDNFQSALTAKLRQLQVVTVFSRLHPILTQHSLLAGLGDRRWSRTVSIDLTLEPELQVAKYSRGHRQRINKLRRLGLTVVHDQGGASLAELARIYEETMHRVDAADRYFFSLAYFQRLFAALGTQIHAFMGLLDGRPVCGGLFATCHGIIQFHLSGTLTEALKLSPMNLLVDTVSQWGRAQHMRTLHLGGGVSSAADDSLLHYKLGFSDRTHDFAVWRWILVPDTYHQLCAAKTQSNRRLLRRASAGDFFPEYRAPTVPGVLPAPDNLPGAGFHAAASLFRAEEHR